MRRTSTNSLVVPMTFTSRSRPPLLISDRPTTSGASRRTAAARCSARASPIVRSRGVLVIAVAGLKPPVCDRPGNTMTRLVPIAENWSTT